MSPHTLRMFSICTIISVVVNPRSLHTALKPSALLVVQLFLLIQIMIASLLLFNVVLSVPTVMVVASITMPITMLLISIASLLALTCAPP